MKKIIKIQVILVLVTALFASCIDDFRFGDAALDKPTGTEINLDSIFARADNARRNLWSLYHYTPTPIRLFGAQGGMTGDWMEGLSDLIHSQNGWGACQTSWYNGSFNATGGTTRWHYSDTRCFEGMRIGFTFLENIDRVPDMSNSEKARLKAEAKVIIAGKVWEMFRQYGGIPLMYNAANPADEVQIERATIEEMYNYMVDMLDEAINEPELPWIIPANERAEWWGRITKASALGQKMLVQLHAASPIYNDNQPYYTQRPGDKVMNDNVKPYIWWGGYKPELWRALVETCEQFFRMNEENGNPYRLIQASTQTEQAYIEAFRDAYWLRGVHSSGASEALYVHSDDWINSWWDNAFTRSPIDWGHQCPTAEFAEMFGWADGRIFDPTGVDNVFYNSKPFVSDTEAEDYTVPDVVKNRPARADNYYIFDNRDPRLYETLWVQHRGQVIARDRAVEIWPKGHTTKIKFADNAATLNYPFIAHGIGHHKWCLDMHSDLAIVRTRPYCWPVIRMGEVHLIYAEALAETGNLQRACEEINKVRSRVGIPAIETSNPQLNLTSNKDNLIKQILRERVCELGYEGTRLTDMIRRKLEADFTKTLHGVWTYRMDGKQGSLQEGEPYPEFWYVKAPVTPVRSWWASEKGWSDRWYLLPFPNGEILKGYGLVQNPGW